MNDDADELTKELFDSLIYQRDINYNLDIIII